VKEEQRGSLVHKLAGDIGGFSLIEVMMALTVFAVGMLAISSLQIATINSNARSRRSMEAVTIAQQQVEALITADYDSVVDNPGPTTINNRYDVSWDVVAEVLNTKDVDLTVSWDEDGGQRSVVLSCVLWNSSS
jgi:type IV pilus assembly protein PilV